MKRMLRRNKKNTTPRSLGCENLEDRRLLAVTVGDIASLRAAVAAAAGGADPVIEFSGPIDINDGNGALVIAGMPMGVTLEIDGMNNSLTQSGTGYLSDTLTNRVITIDDDDGFVNSFAVELRNFSDITGGNGTSYGGGIFNSEDLTISNSTISGNKAVDPLVDPMGPFTGVGGGINSPGNLTMSDSTVSGNTAASLISLPTTGGGFYLEGVAGGIDTGAYSYVNFDNVTVSDNITSNIGAGMSIGGIGPHVIDNSTFSGNMSGNSLPEPYLPERGLNAIGGGLYADAGVPGMNLTIQNSTFSGNMVGNNAYYDPMTMVNDVVFDYGAGLDLTTRGVGDLVTLDNLTVENNRLTSDGVTGASLAIQRGAGIMLTAVEGGTFNLTDSTITGNSMSYLGDFPGYGGGLSVATFDTASGIAYPGYFNVTDTDITNNYALRGGGIGSRYNGGYNNDGIGAKSMLTVTGGSISGNTAVGDGGGAQWAWVATDFTLDGVTISNNYDVGGGGAIANLKAFAGNYSNADLTINNSTLSGNTSLSTGGAVLATTSGLTDMGLVPNTVTINNSTLSGNTAAGNGGGIYAYDSNVTVFQSTISGNSTAGAGGAMNALVACAAYPPDYSDPDNPLPCYTGTDREAQFVIDRSTIAYNYSGGGGTVDAVADTGIDIDNSVLTDNMPSAGFGYDVVLGTPNLTAGSPAEPSRTVDYSLVELDGAGTVAGLMGTGNILNVNGDIGPLMNNGGPTDTHALNMTSPAIDAATPGQGAGETDQRGFGPRDVNGTMDMGSYEYLATEDRCDFDGDNDCDIDDIDLLTVATADALTNPPDLFYDITGDDLVNGDDIVKWLITAGARPENFAFTGGDPFYRGDANLDGLVNGVDFVIWNQNKFCPGGSCNGVAPFDRWSKGNFNGDALINGQDFVIWNANKFCPGPTCNNPDPPITDDGVDPSFDGGRHGFASRAVSDVAPGKRVYRETDALVTKGASTMRLQQQNFQRAGGVVQDEGVIGNTPDVAIDSQLKVRDEVMAEVAKESRVVRAPAAAMRVVATDFGIRENTRSVEKEDAVDSLFAKLG